MDSQLADYVAARWPALVRYATVVTGDPLDAEEIVQAVLVKIAGRWSLLRDRDDVDAYVRTAIVRSHLNLRSRLRRRERRMASPPDVVRADETASVDSAVDIRRALRTLAPRQRAVLVLRFLDDHSEAATAAILGCSVGTVKSQTHKALATLRQQFPDVAEGMSDARYP